MFLVPSLPLPLSIEESHENRNVFIGVLSLGKIFGDHHQWLAGANPTFQEPASSPLQSGRRFPKDDPTRDKTVNDLKGEDSGVWQSQPMDKVELSGTIGKSRRRAATQSISVSSAPEDSIVKAKPR